MIRSAALRVALLALALTMLSTPAANAQKPAPCNGVPLVKDAAGDQTVGFAGNQTPIAADESTDLTQLWFLRTPDGTTTANVSITNLTLGAPPGSLGLIYRWFYGYKGEDRFAEVDIAADGSVSYVYGHFAPTPTQDGETSGTTVPGPDGVISIKLPAAAGGVEGARFTAARVVAAYDMGAVLAGADYAPDEGDKSWNGEVCGAAAGEGTLGPVPATGPLALTVKPTSLKARKARKGAKAKKTTFSLTAREELSDVVAKLKRGGKILGTAKLAKLSTTGKVSFKLKSLKKGKYTLAFSAKRADGSTGKLDVSITVR